jgi:ppGpp synthetase/RelA/SpoT-type nucleotidyltranferase
MARIIPVYSRSKVDAAGDTLLNVRAPQTIAEMDELEEALTIINNWRASHRVPLNSMQVTLRGRAKKIDPKAIVPQRLKRLQAIEAKLRLNVGMKLSRMHDIGGCRAIVKDVKAVRALVKKYEEGLAKNPNKRARFVRKYDYLDDCPKADGYRGVHLVYQYRSEAKDLQPYNGLRIEIQLRSQLQHSFSTAVETASLYTEQPIKAIKANLDDERWRRFFALMGGALAVREKTKMVPGIPEKISDLGNELRALSEQLNVETVLRGVGETAEKISGNRVGAKAWLLLLDVGKRTTEVVGFTKGELPKSEEELLRIEKSVKHNPGQQVVWVRADSIDALRLAYPNFYLNTEAFIQEMKLAIAELR